MAGRREEEGKLKKKNVITSPKGTGREKDVVISKRKLKKKNEITSEHTGIKRREIE